MTNFLIGPVIRIWLPLAAGLAAAVLFFTFGQPPSHHVNDLYHYVIGGKYFHGLGYRGLYAATGLALEEEGLLPPESQIRDLEEKSELLSHDQWRPLGEHYKQALGENWPTFKQDISLFGQQMNGTTFTWEHIFADHGFNPSPGWVLIGAPLLHALPLDRLYPYLPWFDYLLLAGTLTALLLISPPRWRAPVFALFWLALNLFVGNELHIFHWTGGSYLRYSWLLTLTLGAVQLHRGRHFSAGLLFAISGFERIFPLAFLTGAGAALLFADMRTGQLRNRRLSSPTSRFAGGALAALLSLCAITVALFPPQHLGEFIHNMQVHGALLSPNNLGYQKAISYTPASERYRQWSIEPGEAGDIAEGGEAFGEAWFRAMQQRIEENRLAWWMRFALQAFCIVLAIRFMPTALAGLFVGASLIFFNTLAAHYYHVYLAPLTVFALLHLLERGDSTARLLFSALLLFLLGAIGIAILSVNMIFTTSVVSLLLVITVIIGASAHLRGAHRRLTPPLLTAAFLAVNGLHNTRLSAPSLPPQQGQAVLFELDGTSIHQALPRLAAITPTYLDTRGKLLSERGVILREDNSLNLTIPLRSKPLTPLSLTLRSDFTYSVTLSISINGTVIPGEWIVEKLGGMFDYTTITISPHLLTKGENKVALRVTEGPAFALYHLWLTPDNNPKALEHNNRTLPSSFRDV